MKALVWLAAAIILGGLSVQLYNLYRNNSDAAAKLESMRSESEQLNNENIQLRADLDYFSQPENLAKELKTKFDYKRPGEKLIKIQ